MDNNDMNKYDMDHPLELYHMILQEPYHLIVYSDIFFKKISNFEGSDGTSNHFFMKNFQKKSDYWESDGLSNRFFE